MNQTCRITFRFSTISPCLLPPRELPRALVKAVDAASGGKRTTHFCRKRLRLLEDIHAHILAPCRKKPFEYRPRFSFPDRKAVNLRAGQHREGRGSEESLIGIDHVIEFDVGFGGENP